MSQYKAFVAKPIVVAGAVIYLRGKDENQYGTVTRTGNTLRLFACVSKGGISTKKRSQTVVYPTVRIAKEVITHMVGQTCEASLPEA